MNATSDPADPTARMAAAAALARYAAATAGLARYGTEAELRAFVRESLPQALVDSHLRRAQRPASAPPLPPPKPERGREYTTMIWDLNGDGWKPVCCDGSLSQAEDHLAAWKEDLPNAVYAIGFRDVPTWAVLDPDSTLDSARGD